MTRMTPIALILALTACGPSDHANTIADMTGDAASGTIRGIGVFDDAASAGAANSMASFAAFMDSVEGLIEGPPTRTEMDLVHVYVRK